MNSFMFMLCPYRRLYSFMFMARRGAILCARHIKWLPVTNAPALLTQLTHHKNL